MLELGEYRRLCIMNAESGGQMWVAIKRAEGAAKQLAQGAVAGEYLRLTFTFTEVIP
jgi:hypothetical protein